MTNQEFEAELIRLNKKMKQLSNSTLEISRGFTKMSILFGLATISIK